MFFRIKVFRVQVFQGPRPGFRSNLRFFRVQVFQGPSPGFRSTFRFFRVQVYLGPGFCWSRFFRVRVQRKDPGFRSSRKYLLDLIKRRSEVQEKNMSCERAFYQRKTFSKNCKPMRVWLWLAYKFTDNYFSLAIFLRVHSNSEEVSYPGDKMHIRTRKLLVIPN